MSLLLNLTKVEKTIKQSSAEGGATINLTTDN